MAKEEMETIINYNQEEDMAEVYTCDKVLIRKIERLREKHRVINEISRDAESATYLIPKKWVKVNAPRLLTEEKRQKAQETARKNFGL